MADVQQSLVPREAGPLTRVDQTVTAIDKLLADPAQLAVVPVETVERLYAVHKEERAESARRAFNEAFHQAKIEMTPVRREGFNDHTKSWFAKLDHVVQMLEPVALQNGFTWSVSNRPCELKDHIRVVLLIRHTAGHTEEHFFDAPIDTTGPGGRTNKTRLHGSASSMTYSERHLLTKVWAIPTYRDDDGNAGAGVGIGGAVITEVQAHDLENLMDEVNADRARFFGMYGVKKVEELPAVNYKAAMSLLMEKKRLQEKAQ